MDPIKRAVLGFVAAVISVLTFHQAVWGIYHMAGLLPLAPYPMLPTKPLGVPLIASLCFWGGLYGAAFGLLLPRMRGPIVLWGLATGLLAACVGFTIVPALKGIPLSFASVAVVRSLMINGAWGIGLGLIAPLLMRPRRMQAVA